MKISNDSNHLQIQEEIGRRVRSRRIGLRLGQKELAIKTGLSLKSISNIENGKEISFKSLILVLRALNLIMNLDVLIPEPIGFDIKKNIPLSEKKRHRNPKKPTPSFAWRDK